MAQGEGGGGHYADRMRQKKPKAKAVSAPAKSDDEIIESLILKPVKKRPPIPRAKPAVTADAASIVRPRPKPKRTLADWIRGPALTSELRDQRKFKFAEPDRSRKATFGGPSINSDQDSSDMFGKGGTLFKQIERFGGSR